MKCRKAIKISAIVLGVIVVLAFAFSLYLTPGYDRISFPDGKKFAFSICDDTDASTLENVSPIYRLLDSLGIRTTKTVWVFPSTSEAFPDQGQTLGDSVYLDFVLGLRDRGFEIASHGARGGSSKRDETIRSLHVFDSLIGYYPRIYINHYHNAENLYWGVYRLDYWPLRMLYNLTRDDVDYVGHLPETEFFWGDIAKEYIEYVPNFSFYEINLRKVNPDIPYHDPKRPYVNFWFHTSDGMDVHAFNDLLSEENLDKLEEEGGVCIVYTHFAYDFCRNGEINDTTVERLKDLASREGWFVPASEILDYLREIEKGGNKLSLRQRLYLQFRWIKEKIVYGSS
ncbi:MAG TPA: hypothetical protein ENO22_03685 [candidate division Zixibacteria bacterium]|nr:hypothetical protein [candidate division Zixibacteria bacterium]HEQ98426.1 hypothetical protein [candidate division Zixibacteria bacterium]